MIVANNSKKNAKNRQQAAAARNAQAGMGQETRPAQPVYGAQYPPQPPTGVVMGTVPVPQPAPVVVQSYEAQPQAAVVVQAVQPPATYGAEPQGKTYTRASQVGY